MPVDVLTANGPELRPIKEVSKVASGKAGSCRGPLSAPPTPPTLAS